MRNKKDLLYAMSTMNPLLYAVYFVMVVVYLNLYFIPFLVMQRFFRTVAEKPTAAPKAVVELFSEIDTIFRADTVLESLRPDSKETMRFEDSSASKWIRRGYTPSPLNVRPKLAEERQEEADRISEIMMSLYRHEPLKGRSTLAPSTLADVFYFYNRLLDLWENERPPTERSRRIRIEDVPPSLLDF